MKKFIKKLSVGLVVAMLTIGSAFTAFASVAGDTNNDVAKVLQEIDNLYQSNTSTYQQSYSDAQDTWNNLTSNGSIGIEFNGVTKMFTNTTLDNTNGTMDPNFKTAYDSMNAHLTIMKSKNNNNRNAKGARDNLQTVVDSMNTQADIASAAEGLSDVMPLVNQITGMIVMVVTIGMAIFTALDVAYLVFPVAKTAMDSAGSSGNRSVSKTDGKTGEAKFRWITDDAINAYQQYTETGKNPLLCYLGKRIWSYIALAIVIYMLMSGNLSVIINFVLSG